MAKPTADMGTGLQHASRRHFFKLLAGSPLLATAYPALSPAWQQEVRARVAAGAHRRRARGHGTCADAARPSPAAVARRRRVRGTDGTGRRRSRLAHSTCISQGS